MCAGRQVRAQATQVRDVVAGAGDDDESGAHLFLERARRCVDVAGVRSEAEGDAEQAGHRHRDLGLRQREVRVHLSASARSLDGAGNPGSGHEQGDGPQHEDARTMGKREQRTTVRA